MIFTTMQSIDSALRLVPARRRSSLRTEADETAAAKADLPVAGRIALLAARRVGGYPQAALTDSLRQTPTTAHLLGGAVIGRDADHGVVDRDHRVFGYQRLLICDGSAIPANVGVNPSLTIAALAERAMQSVPPASDRTAVARPKDSARIALR